MTSSPTDGDSAVSEPPNRPPDTNAPGGADTAPPNLTAIQQDLTAVEAALTALDDGTYWIDDVTGEPIPDEVLAANPVARHA